MYAVPSWLRGASAYIAIFLWEGETSHYMVGGESREARHMERLRFLRLMER